MCRYPIHVAVLAALVVGACRREGNDENDASAADAPAVDAPEADAPEADAPEADGSTEDATAEDAPASDADDEDAPAEASFDASDAEVEPCDGTCGGDQYCAPSDELCGRSGICLPKPSDCADAPGPPVCGCDNASYLNDCLRKQAGVALLHEGHCDVECGDAAVCGADAFCIFSDNSWMGGESTWGCSAIPPDCLLEPACFCGESYNPCAGECRDTDIGLLWCGGP